MKLMKERIITVGHFAWSRALLLQIILQDSGIDCFLVSRDTVLPRGYVDMRVKEKDVENALKIIKLSSHDTGTAQRKSHQKDESYQEDHGTCRFFDHFI